ncbi:hypothetical protein QJQ45_008287 [Haematococcus lacustris]|nr:hypothetical protein QJQ45_008287 [Haematococcus lacustris]
MEAAEVKGEEARGEEGKEGGWVEGEKGLEEEGQEGEAMERESSLAQDSTGERAKRLLAAANAYLKVKRGQPQPSMAAVAREHCVPYATLHRVIKRGGVIAKRGRPTALSAVEEEQLRDLVVRGQQQGVGVTKTASLAAVRTTQRVTERKGKVDPFKGKAPGKNWRQGFMRHLVTIIYLKYIIKYR